MFQTWICALVVFNVVFLSIVIIVAVILKPNWMVLSKYQILSDAQTGIFLCIVLFFGALYEAQGSDSSRISKTYAEIIYSEMPKSLTACLLSILATTVFLHMKREDLLMDISRDGLFVLKIEKLIRISSIFLLISLNFLSLYTGTLFTLVANLAIFFLPCNIDKIPYIEAHYNENLKGYYKLTLITQGIMVFKHLVFSIFSVRTMQSYLNWPLFNILSSIFNSRVVWDLIFICADFEQEYTHGLDWHIYEIIMFIILIFCAFQAFIGSSLTNKHLFPAGMIFGLFGKSWPLKIFAFTLAAINAFNLGFLKIDN